MGTKIQIKKINSDENIFIDDGELVYIRDKKEVLIGKNDFIRNDYLPFFKKANNEYVGNISEYNLSYGKKYYFYNLSSSVTLNLPNKEGDDEIEIFINQNDFTSSQITLSSSNYLIKKNNSLTYTLEKNSAVIIFQNNMFVIFYDF